jgi:FemAB-related protein (PEP-CTERM system-associated)
MCNGEIAPGVVPLALIGTKRWDQYVKNHPQSSLYHFSAWQPLFQKVYKLRGVYLAKVDSQSNITGILPLLQQKSTLFGNHLLSLPFFINYAGVLADDDQSRTDLLEAAVKQAKQLGAERVELRGIEAQETDWQCRDSKICMHLALPETSEELWKALGAKRRSQVNRPERENIEIIHGGRECVDDFYEVIARNMKDLGSPVHAKSLYYEICETFPENTHIVLIKKDGVAAAAAFLIGYKEMLEIPWASSLREYNPIGVNMRLYWEVLKYAIDHGYRTFDFGRSSKDSGTYRFKKQWGAEPVQCYWYNWSESGDDGSELSNDNPKFQLAIKIWQRMPLQVTKILGPKLVKFLP